MATETPRFRSPDEIVNQATIEAQNSTIAKAKERPRFVENLATVFGGQLACGLVALLIEISYARLIGPAGRGQISLCMMVIAIGSTLGGLGGEVPIIIWAAEKKKALSEWLPSIWVLGGAGCVAFDAVWGAIYWKWHPSFLRGITPPLAVLVLASVPAAVAIQYLLALFVGMEQFRKRAGVALVSQAVELTAFVALALLIGRTAAMAILGNLFGLLAAAAIAKLFLRESASVRSEGGSPTGLGPALSMGVRGQFGNVAMLFNYRLDVFVLNYFLNPAQVGLYALGVVISESLWQIPSAASVALFPRTARTVDRDANRFTCFVTRQVLLLAGAFGVAMALASPLAIPLIFGSRFAPSVAVIWWILPGTVALAAGKVMAADITARGKPEYNSIISIVVGGLTVVLDLVLIPRMGIRGAALASSIAYLVQAGLIAGTLKHLLAVTWTFLFAPLRGEFGIYASLWRDLRSKLKHSRIIEAISTGE
jgi:O-antigen/teichoic acid export membrane protein